MASVVDNIRGQMEAGFEQDRLRADGYDGESHRHIILIMAIIGLIVFSLNYLEVIALATWPTVGVWMGATLLAYAALRLLPNCLSGGIMGILTGTIDVYIGQVLRLTTTSVVEM